MFWNGNGFNYSRTTDNNFQILLDKIQVQMQAIKNKYVGETGATCRSFHFPI